MLKKARLLQVLNFERDVSDITSRDVIEMMMITQYFDMLKDIGVSNRNSTVFLPHSPANVADVAGQIRAGFMQVTCNVMRTDIFPVSSGQSSTL